MEEGVEKGVGEGRRRGGVEWSVGGEGGRRETTPQSTWTDALERTSPPSRGALHSGAVENSSEPMRLERYSDDSPCILHSAF